MFTVNVAPWLKVQTGPSMRFVADMKPKATGLNQLNQWIKGPHRELTMPMVPKELKDYEALITLKP